MAGLCTVIRGPVDMATCRPQRSNHLEERRGISILRKRSENRKLRTIGDGLTRECHAAVTRSYFEQGYRTLRRKAANPVAEANSLADVSSPVFRRLRHLRRDP